MNAVTGQRLITAVSVVLALSYFVVSVWACLNQIFPAAFVSGRLSGFGLALCLFLVGFFSLGWWQCAHHPGSWGDRHGVSLFAGFVMGVLVGGCSGGYVWFRSDLFSGFAFGSGVSLLATAGSLAGSVVYALLLASRTRLHLSFGSRT